MANSTFFVQGCPTCGRRLEIRVEHLGRKVVCQHCQAQFVARDPANTRWDAAESDNALLRRAEELIASADRRNSRQPHPR